MRQSLRLDRPRPRNRLGLLAGSTVERERVKLARRVSPRGGGNVSARSNDLLAHNALAISTE